MTRYTVFAIAVAALLTVQSAEAQAQSDLGTKAELAREFSTNYRDLVKAAVPAITAQELTNRLQLVERASATTPPLKIDGVRALEKFFGLPEAPLELGQTRVSYERAAYSFDPIRTRLYIAFRNLTSEPIVREEFAKYAPKIRRVHEQLVRNFGLDPKEVLFTDFRETLSQANANPQTIGEKELPIMSEGASTLILRAVAGIQVERSRVVVSSIDPRQLEVVMVEWPSVRLSPAVWNSGVIEPQALVESITERIAAHAKGRAVNVRMAVVLRDVIEDGRLIFVPALRVGVQPQPIVTREGVATEAGDSFYLDLVGRSPADPERGNSGEEAAVELPTTR